MTPEFLKAIVERKTRIACKGILDALESIVAGKTLTVIYYWDTSAAEAILGKAVDLQFDCPADNPDEDSAVQLAAYKRLKTRWDRLAKWESYSLDHRQRIDVLTINRIALALIADITSDARQGYIKKLEAYRQAMVRYLQATEETDPDIVSLSLGDHSRLQKNAGDWFDKEEWIDRLNHGIKVLETRIVGMQTLVQVAGAEELRGGADPRFDFLIKGLVPVFKAITGKNITFSRSTARAADGEGLDTPFVRFARHVLSAVDWTELNGEATNLGPAFCKRCERAATGHSGSAV